MRPNVLSGALFGSSSSVWIVPLLRPYYRPVLGLAAFTLLSSLLGLLTPWLTQLLIDEGLLRQDFPALLRYGMALFVIGLLASASGVFNSYQHLRFSIRLLNDVRAFLFRSLLQLSPRQHAQLRTGEMMSRLDGDASELQRFAFDALLSGGGAVVRMLGSAAFMLWLNWQLTLLVLVLVPAELWFLLKVRPGTELRAREVREQRGLLAALLNESVTAIPVLQSLSAQSVRLQQVQERQAMQGQMLLRQRLWSEGVNLFPALATALGRMAILLLGGYWVIRGELSLGGLIAFLSYLGFILGPMHTLLGLYQAQARVKAAVTRLDGIALLQPDIPERPEGAAVATGGGDLELRQVTAGHDSKGTPVLEQYNLHIPAGSKVLLQGASGAGKSTVCALLSGFLLPQQGSVRFQQQAFEYFQLASFRRAVVLLPQNAFVFHGSVLENFRLARPDVSEAEAWQVLEWVRLDQWLRDLGGLEVQLGERGLNVSGGQRQRLAIARVLLLPFQVLIMDESLSEVDPVTAQAIVATLDREFAHTTRIFVAHGQEAIFAPCDRVVQLDAVRGRAT